MDLKSTINNTNTQKENIKTVATQIDNKLVELGGERAIDLADVPNKIKTMIESYVKTATGTMKNVKADARNTGVAKVIIPLNLQSTPKKVILKLESSLDYYTPGQEATILLNGSYKPEMYSNIYRIDCDELNKTRAVLFLYFSTEEKYKVNLYWTAII